MSHDDYFVRSRGRVQGPFTLAALQRRLKAGTLSRFDQVSTDRKNWDPVSKMAELSELEPPIKLEPVAEPEAAPKPPAPPKPVAPSEPTEPETYALASNGDEAGDQPRLSPLGRPRPRGWVGTAVSGGFLIVLVVNLPQSATEDGLRFWWMRDVLIQLMCGVLLILGVLCAALPLFVRRRAEVWLGGIGGAILVTQAVSLLLAGDTSHITGKLNFTASSVVDRLAVLQVFIFVTLLVTALVLVTLATAIWIPSRRQTHVAARSSHE